MKYFCIEPEVAGGLGENTVMDRHVHPPVVNELHYQVDGWLGDVLLESFPCFIVTDLARQAIEAARLTGARFDDVEVTTSEQFQELCPTLQLPKFVWLRVDGNAEGDDFGTARDGRLIVSERALELLRTQGISHASITEFGR